jgi:hypothetical protein
MPTKIWTQSVPALRLYHLILGGITLQIVTVVNAFTQSPTGSGDVYHRGLRNWNDSQLANIVNL